MSQRGVLFYLKVREQEKNQAENLDRSTPVDSDDCVPRNDSHLQACNSNSERFNDEREIDL
eukprot:1197651-Alexandrium_andersonii.AAC.1